MTGRELTLDDVAALTTCLAAAAEADHVYAAVTAIARETCGFKLLTVLAYDEAAGAAIRVHSSDPASYPVGGTKLLRDFPVNHAAMQSGDGFLAANAAEVRAAFADHEMLASLGISAILNAPIRNAGRRLGTLNLSGTEGQYGEREKQVARILAGLIVPLLI